MSSPNRAQDSAFIARTYGPTSRSANDIHLVHLTGHRRLSISPGSLDRSVGSGTLVRRLVYGPTASLQDLHMAVQGFGTANRKTPSRCGSTRWIGKLSPPAIPPLPLFAASTIPHPGHDIGLDLATRWRSLRTFKHTRWVRQDRKSVV